MFVKSMAKADDVECPEGEVNFVPILSPESVADILGAKAEHTRDVDESLLVGEHQTDVMAIDLNPDAEAEFGMSMAKKKQEFADFDQFDLGNLDFDNLDNFDLDNLDFDYFDLDFNFDNFDLDNLEFDNLDFNFDFDNFDLDNFEFDNLNKFECTKAMVKVANGLADNGLTIAVVGESAITAVMFDEGRHSERAMAVEDGLDMFADSDTLDHKGGLHEAMSSGAIVLQEAMPEPVKVDVLKATVQLQDVSVYEGDVAASLAVVEVGKGAVDYVLLLMGLVVDAESLHQRPYTADGEVAVSEGEMGEMSSTENSDDDRVGEHPRCTIQCHSGIEVQADSDCVAALAAFWDVSAPNGGSSLTVCVYGVHCVMTLGVVGGEVLHGHIRDDVKSFDGSKSLCMLGGPMSLGIFLKVGALIPDAMRKDVQGEMAIVYPASAAQVKWAESVPEGGNPAHSGDV